MSNANPAAPRESLKTGRPLIQAAAEFIGSMPALRTSLLAFAAALSLHAASAENLIQFPAGAAAWTVDIVPYSTGRPPAALTPTGPDFDIQRIDITQIDGITRSNILWGNGKTSVRWSFGQNGMMILTETYNGEPTLLAGADIRFGGQFTVGFDASCFTWLKPDLLTGKVLFQKKKCLHYEGTIMVHRSESVAYGTTNGSEVPYHVEAWIEEETLLPVAFYDGNKLGVYTFREPPTGSFNLPPAIKKAIDHYVAASRPLN